MTENDRRTIAACGRRAERELILASVYEQVGDEASVQFCREQAEVDSFIAFRVATRA